MTLPTVPQIMLPLLQHVQDGEVYTVRGLKDVLADTMDLTDADRALMLESKPQSKFHNRIAWAKAHIERAGLLNMVRRGHFTISERGKQVLAEQPTEISESYLMRFDEYREFRAGSQTKTSTNEAESIENDEGKTPEEDFQNAYNQIRNDLAHEILSNVKNMSPAFFEKLVLDLMLAMGYGGTANSGHLTGASADEGIDGIINEDRLGLDIIYLQAKRWENPVGRPEIQKFVGALQGKRAKKGVFLTTSTFSREAIAYVETIDAKVVLIDGRRLSQLMVDFDVGVSTAQTFAIKKIDSDYFIED